MHIFEKHLLSYVPFTYLYTYLSIYLPIYLSIYLPIYLSVYLPKLTQLKTYANNNWSTYATLPPNAIEFQVFTK